MTAPRTRRSGIRPAPARNQSMKILRIILALCCAIPAFAQKEALQRAVGTNTVTGSLLSTPFQVATIASLKAATVTNIPNGTQVYVSGYYATGDGGEGFFTYNSASSATADNGVVVAPNSGSGRWIRNVQSQDANPRWWGAKGDGVTTDTTAIQAGINYVNSLGSGVLKFNAGTYLCNVILKQGVQLIGFAGVTGVDAGGGGVFGVTLQNAVTGPVVDTPAGITYNVAIVGINFRGLGASPASVGVRFRNVGTSLIRNCNFNNFSDQAVMMNAGIANEFIGIRAQNCLLNRVQATPTGVIHADGTDHFFDRCELTASCSREGTKTAAGNCNALYLSGANHFLSNCIGEISDSGFYIAGTGYNRLVNCRGDLNYMHGFDFATGISSVVGCLALNNSQDTTNTYSGFHVKASTAQGLTFAACISDSITAKVQKYGFEDLAEYSAVESRNQYVGCRAGGAGTAGFYTVPTNGIGSGVVFGGLAIVSSSVGSITISVAQANDVLLGQGSATTVTNFTGGISGQSIFIRGNTNVTIANNATIKTSTGADKILANNKVYQFKLLGSVWYEITN